MWGVQRGRVCAAVGYTVLKAISEKYPDYYSPEVFVQGVLKAYPLKGNGPVNTGTRRENNLTILGPGLVFACI